MSLRKSAFSAARWTTASTVTRALMQFLQTALLARLLAPADFGLVALAGASLAVVAMFADLGISNALLHFPRPSRKILSSLFWINAWCSLLLMAGMLAVAPVLATAYDAPGLAPLLGAMSLSLPLGAAGAQLRTLAAKELRFAELARNEMAATAAGFCVAIGLALSGAGAYALVGGVLATAAFGSAFAWMFLGHSARPGWEFAGSGLSPFVRFGGYKLGEAIASTARMQFDVLLAGFFAGSVSVGLYSVPRDLSLRIANTVVNPVVTRIGLPLMAKVQSDVAALKRIYLQSLRMTASINFPIYAILAAWPAEVIAILLGPQWHEGAFYLRVFAAWGLVRSPGNPVGSLLYAAGEVRRAFWWNLVLLLLVPGCLWAGAAIAALPGLAVALLATQVLIFLPAWRYLVQPVCGATLGEYLSQLWPPLAAAATAAATGYAAAQSWTRPLATLSVGLVVFSLVYMAASYRLNTIWFAAMVELVRPPTWRRGERPE